MTKFFYTIALILVLLFVQACTANDDDDLYQNIDTCQDR